MTRYASPEDVERAVERWGQDVLDCRAFGHDWQPSTATYSRDGRTIHVTHVCGRVNADGDPHAERSLELDARTGWVRKSHINYDPDYLLHDLGRITGDAKGVVRLASLAPLLPRRRPR